MKIIIIINHFQHQDGVCRAAIGMANALAEKEGLDITLCPLFAFEESMIKELDKRVIIKPIFKMYFRGFQKIIGLIPKRFLHRIVIGNHYDIEIGYCMRMPIQIVASAASRKMKDARIHTKYYAWMHGYDEGLTLRKEYEEIGKVICVSKYNAERLREESDDRFAVEYAYNLIDESSIIKQGQKTIMTERPDDTLFCSVGRFTPEKGYVRLIRVVKRLNVAGYKFHLWLIGDGPERENIENEIIKLHLDNVSLLGKQKNPHAYTSKSDVFVCSSFSEGYSTACTEAAILGVPVISTDVPGAKEIITDSDAGMVVENSEDGLYEGMRIILESKDMLNKWKKNIIKGKESFSTANRINKILKALGV